MVIARAVRPVGINSTVVLPYAKDHRYLLYLWRGQRKSKSKQERYSSKRLLTAR